MKIPNCGDPTPKVVVSPETYNCCMFEVVDTWDESKHAKTCDTMFYLSDGTGAYVWDGTDWLFLNFTGGDFVSTETFEDYQADQAAQDEAQDERLDELEAKVPEIPKITQVKTTLGTTGITDSEIFNPDVIASADLLWTKQELPEGNLVLINGVFTVKEDQPDSYKNIFWTSPEGFELPEGLLQFVPIMHWTPITSASLNTSVDVDGVKGWTNYASISAGAYIIDVTLRGE